MEQHLAIVTERLKHDKTVKYRLGYAQYIVAKQLITGSSKEKKQCLLKERKILQNVRTDPDEAINRVSYELYKLFQEEGDLKKALFYIEKATFFSLNRENMV